MSAIPPYPHIAPTGVEPVMEESKSSALPLGDGASYTQLTGEASYCLTAKELGIIGIGLSDKI